MLYGHIEGVEDIVNHLIRLRDLQDKTGGFVAFVPLSFRPQNTKMANLTGPSVFTDIKVCSIARLLLDNFPHIKVYWVTAGIKLLPVLLHFGASDAHGTAFEERIIHKGGCGAIIGTAGGITPQELEGFIREAGYIPVRQKVAP
jgi:aminodeoxyfutalosine synthase